MVLDMLMPPLRAALLAPLLLMAGTAVALAQDDGEAMADEDGVPLYRIEEGRVDRGTYNGYRRYHNSCHVCHGADGLGSSFAPALAETMDTIDYYAFLEVVASGRQNPGATGNRVMPSFGTDPNVMDHIDDIYRYLKARSEGELGRGRPVRLEG